MFCLSTSCSFEKKHIMKTLFTIITSLITLFSFSQDSLRNRYSVATDLSPYAFNGYSLKLGITPKSHPKYDLSVEVFSMEIPELVINLNSKNKDKDWKEKVNYGVALYGDKKLGEKRNSFWVGAGIVYLNQTVSNPIEHNQFNQLEILGRINYKWFPFNNGFYINPYFALAGRQKIGGENGSYQLAPLMGFLSVYLSWEI